MNNSPVNQVQFIQTKEYLRFEEFVEACKKYRYIGVCYGKPGIGKSFSANSSQSSLKRKGQSKPG